MRKITQWMLLLAVIYVAGSFCAQQNLLDLALEKAGVWDESTWDSAVWGP